MSSPDGKIKWPVRVQCALICNYDQTETIPQISGLTISQSKDVFSVAEMKQVTTLIGWRVFVCYLNCSVYVLPNVTAQGFVSKSFLSSSSSLILFINLGRGLFTTVQHVIQFTSIQFYLRCKTIQPWTTWQRTRVQWLWALLFGAF